MHHPSTEVDSSTLRPLFVTYRPTGSLKPDPRNARTHSKRQVEQIIASIREFGFTNPILLGPEGVLIAGHGRLLAATSMGMKEVPTIELVGLNDGQKRALRLADNKIALGAGWDLDLLKVELAELSVLDVNMDFTVTGFSTGELDVLLGSNEDPEDDVIPRVPLEPRTKPVTSGSLATTESAPAIVGTATFCRRSWGENAQIDAAFLDPPYNVRINGHANAKGRHREFAMASGEMTDTAFRAFLTDTLGAAARVSRDGAIHFICMDWRHMDDVSIVSRGIYGDLLNLCVWNKSNAGMGSLYRSKHELVFVYRVGTAPNFNAVELGRHGRNRTNVWDYASVNSLAGSRREDLALHPTVKPTALVADAVQDGEQRLSHDDQRTVVRATRTPSKVRWPDWWEIRP